VQATPRTFELLEVVVVQDLVDLLGELAVEFGNDRLDRLDDIVADQLRLRQRLLCQGLDGTLTASLRAVRSSA
jgi:hypothetical protein